MKCDFNQCSAVNAFLWGCAIIAAAILLKGTEYLTLMIVVLGGAGGASVCYSSCKKEEK
jgi:hypothetical protein